MLVLLGLLLVASTAVVGCGPGAEQATGTVHGTVVRPPAGIRAPVQAARTAQTRYGCR
ncbi:hypothetical protein [Streptomyces sp. NPDC127092]|uniref:hypothetical protein n=1 Tax=Streptomyces sp. NPDC127092 TaxID=3347135 RepID=UPI0036530C5A